ncbi:MAG: cyclic nucleotide-binding domain-containing protein [Burkholderiales bacterium]
MSYDAAVALDFFQSTGRAKDIGKGTVIFAEKESDNPLLFQHSKIYLLVEGEVGLLAGLRPIGTVRKGEIFGEMATITHAPRSATAVAKTDCRVIALGDKELESALEKQPVFALMLMSLMIGRLRETIARLAASGALAQGTEWKEAAAFGRKQLDDLVRGLVDDPPVYYQRGQSIMSEGQKAIRMYVVLEGRVAVSIGGRVVERLGPGGAFGEAALVDPSPRLASAVAETDCELLPITRQAFLALVKLNAEFAYSMLSALAARLRFLTERIK